MLKQVKQVCNNTYKTRFKHSPLFLKALRRFIRKAFIKERVAEVLRKIHLSPIL
jgi:hypothetical protein